MVDKDAGYRYSSVQSFNPECAPSLQVYPNPAHTNAIVNGLQASMQVNVVDAQGRLLWSSKAVGGTLQIPLSSYADGLLLIQVKDRNGKVVSSTRLLKN
jgi:hypothetical protein